MLTTSLSALCKNETLSRLLQPHPGLSDENQHWARTLLGLSLAAFVTWVVLVTFARFWSIAAEFAVYPFAYDLVILALLAVTYGLGRTRFYLLGSFMIALVPISTNLLVWMSFGQYDDGSVYTLFWATLSVLFGSLVLPWRLNLIVILAVCLYVNVIAALIAGWELGDSRTISITFFVICASALMTAFNVLRQRYLKRLHVTQQQLNEMVGNLEARVDARTQELRQALTEVEAASRSKVEAEAERARLQQQVIETQRRVIQELSTPVIPLMDGVIVMPLVGAIDTARAQDITRSLLNGITQYRARIVILDITGVPVVDSGIANHLNCTVLAARLKGTQTIVTGISDSVAETIVDLGIDWSSLETLRDMQSGLRCALSRLGIQLTPQSSNGHVRNIA